ncbi:MAG: PP2C family protein-serine/threonine phosphatase [Candidatus Acidiferrum sp.]
MKCAWESMPGVGRALRTTRSPNSVLKGIVTPGGHGRRSTGSGVGERISGHIGGHYGSESNADFPQSDPVDVRLARVSEELDRERQAVGEIQRSLLPASLPQLPGFEMSPYYQPSEHASGDYYDVVPLIDDQWGFVMADMSGHGIPVAVTMTVMRILIHAELPSNRDKSAGEFLERVNRVMCETYLRDSRFVTVWAAVLNPVSRRLTYASAGHNPPRPLRGGHVLALDVVGGLPLGFDPTATYEDAGITLEPEDLLMVYTDGITEAMREGIDGLELFGTEGLDHVLSEFRSDRACDFAERVSKAIAAFTNDAAPTDDRTMLILRAISRSPRRRTTSLHSSPL